MKRLRLVVAWCVAAACVAGFGCVDTQQDRVVVPLRAAGSDVPARFETSRGVSVALDRADLAFGPFYLCASTEAGEACDTARAEWLGSAVIDTLDPAPFDVGELSAVNGPYRSFMYDLGIVSLLTRNDAVVFDAAEQLGDVSVVLEGRVDLGSGDVPFSIALPIARTADNEQGVPVVRVRAEPSMHHEITPADTALQVRFDPRPWVTSIDFTSLCADAAACTDIAPSSQGARAVRNALTAGTPPALEWNP